MATIVKLTDGTDIATITEIDGKKAVDVNIASITLSAGDDSIEVRSLPSAVRLDDYTTANVTYIGEAVVGASTAAAVWRIKKMNETTGVSITFADSDSNFDNVWDNRASLTYG